MSSSSTVAHLSPNAPSGEAILQEVFGYHAFRDGQEKVIETLTEGQDCLVIMPTGGGKSLCYQIPALLSDGVALVISPLISLMKDQVDQLQANGVAAAYLNSTQQFDEINAIYQQAMQGELKLLYVSPERALSREFLTVIESVKLSLVAIDEAHCVSQWGHDFRPEYAAIGRMKQAFGSVPFIALTATADDTTRQDIIRSLSLEDPYIYLGSFDRPNIRYILQEKYKPMAQLQRYLKDMAGQSGIIYCNSRKRVEQISEKLNEQGIRAAAYHAGLEHQERADVQEAFLRDDLQVVVATVAFGMGINKSNVRFVVHHDIPRNIESYYQETGRAGRDGLPAEAMMMYDPADLAWLRRCLDEKPDEQQRLIEGHKLTAMGAFAEAQTCRRQVLLHYFGESRHQPCGNCDVCLDPPQNYSATEDAQKALSCVYRVQQSFGVNHVVEVLRGMHNQRIRDFGHDKLSTYGLGKEHSHEYWVGILRQLIHRGYLVQNIMRSSTLQLTESARPLLRGEIELTLAVPRINTAARNAKQDKLISRQYDKKLFAKLRKLRKSISEQEELPPYVVFNDATLMEMSERLPTNNNELLMVNGVGQRKLEKYGEVFLTVIEDHLMMAQQI